MVKITQIERYLADTEALVPGLRPGCEKQIVWAGESATKTRYCLLYVHGFSATGQELRPLPDLVAQNLGANLYFTRLTGHGQDGAAMARATLADWMRDMVEAVDIAATLGDAVIVMGCSTGCTLTTLALAEGSSVQAAIFVSPNFGLRQKMVQWLIDLPGVRHWGKYLAGDTREFKPISDAHTAYWTTRYPTQSIHPMADAVRAVWQADLSRIKTPVLFAYNLADQVVDPLKTRKAMERWGGPTEEVILTPEPGDDAMGHVMAGDVFSPSQTRPLARQISAWLAGL